MEPVSFKSAHDKEVQRNCIREGRNSILEKAQEDFEKRQRREKERREQEKWMLPSVNERLEESGKKSKKDKKDRSKKSKHKAKDKKCKKANGKKLIGCSRKDQSDSASSTEDSESESDAEQWVEKTAISTSTPSTDQKSVGNPSRPQGEKLQVVQRDPWMVSAATPSGYVPTFSREERRPSQAAKLEQKRRRELLEKPGQYERELNPYWKDGGSGLPENEDSAGRKTTGNFGSTVGDGGVKWLERAYRRAREQANEENRTLESVAAERWGSLEKLESMLNKARLKDRGEEDVLRSERSRRREFRRPDECSDDRDESHRSSGYEDDRRLTRHESPPSIRDVKRTSFLKPDSDGRQPESNRSSLPATVPSHSRWRKKEFVKTAPAAAEFQFDLKEKREKIKEEVEPSKITDLPKIQQPQTTPPLLTDKQMNDLGAKIIKAELLGNDELAAKLRSQLESARELKSSNMANEGDRVEEQVVIVKSKRDTESPGTSGVRLVKKQRVETHDADGQRARYFADDDKYSLKQMFEREKMGTAEDHNAMFARLIGKGAEKTTDEYDIDEQLATRASRHVSDEKVDEQMRQRLLQEHRRSNAAMDNCRLCFEGKDTPKHLIVAIGIKTYLTLPPYKSLSSGHCLVVPMQHVSAATYLDEDIWSEVQIFRKGLTRMFEDRQQDVVFFETSLNLKRFPHMVLQCVPLPKDVGNLAPMYFKKAILESEMEWSNNKKLVDLSQKDVRRAVPKGLPYFSVDFGLQGGFAHVVEDEQLFPKNFAQEIIGGLLDLDPIAWRRPPRENFDDQRKKVLEFAEWWKPYDWTRRLKEDG